MMQKIFNLLNSQYIDREGRLKVLKAARSLGEHIYNDFILHHQNPQQLTDNLQKHLESLRKFDLTNNPRSNAYCRKRSFTETNGGKRRPFMASVYDQRIRSRTTRNGFRIRWS
jgi:hypothetical protein